ncbi:SRPBCC family protein [Mucilaginibacter terrae]|uniref:Uncharacterized protein YndB with AHSA1/START domain n=1 Tax=Mucilaginibacter terrae TaxID=1955052 RepID=A0ABU3GT72_9SPHI|nr:SRPBCC family protein [Mucilaginibacter terrae]MDT3401855.1 uncharacterized protein YndB with AHSA1/START domain [Mucilaginibacter terrae]
MIKKILIGIIGLIASLLVVAIFVPKDYTVERQITINKPVTEIFDYIKYLKNQDEYSKWASMDPNMKKTYSGTDATPGFVSAWESDVKDVGQGEQKILSIVPDKQINYDLHFIKPFEGRAEAIMKTQDNGNSTTTVKWSIASSMPYPTNLMRLFMNIEEMIGNDLDTGLKNLKGKFDK